MEGRGGSETKKVTRKGWLPSRKSHECACEGAEEEDEWNGGVEEDHGRDGGVRRGRLGLRVGVGG